MLIHKTYKRLKNDSGLREITNHGISSCVTEEKTNSSGGFELPHIYKLWESVNALGWVTNKLSKIDNAINIKVKKWLAYVWLFLLEETHFLC